MGEFVTIALLAWLGQLAKSEKTDDKVAFGLIVAVSVSLLFIPVAVLAVTITIDIFIAIGKLIAMACGSVTGSFEQSRQDARIRAGEAASDARLRESNRRALLEAAVQPSRRQRVDELRRELDERLALIPQLVTDPEEQQRIREVMHDEFLRLAEDILE